MPAVPIGIEWAVTYPIEIKNEPVFINYKNDKILMINRKTI